MQVLGTAQDMVLRVDCHGDPAVGGIRRNSGETIKHCLDLNTVGSIQCYPLVLYNQPNWEKRKFLNGIKFLCLKSSNAEDINY